MSVYIGHPSGNQNFREAVGAFYRHGKLGRAASCLKWNGRLAARLTRMLPGSVSRECARRSFPQQWAGQLETHPWRELGRLVSQRFQWTSLSEGEQKPLSVDAIYNDFDRWVARSLERWTDKYGIRAVYGYEDGALHTFEMAQRLSLARLYDLPIAYWETGRRLMGEEALRYPGWRKTLGGGITDSTKKLERKRKELELAQTIIVPSRFVADSLPSWASETRRIVITHFGSPEPMEARVLEECLQQRSRRAQTGQPLRVLFVGSMGQRKGLGDLFAAIRTLKRADVELVVMGAMMEEAGFYSRQGAPFRYERGRPHAEVLELMRSCDVFCLPSLVEGRALVMQEAMSQGLPLIVTPNSGGDDLIEPGKTGFLVSIRAPEALAERISWCADHRSEVIEMGRQAVRKAGEYSWENYGNVLVKGVHDSL